MGSEQFVCDGCGDAEEVIGCESWYCNKCGKSWCSQECADEDGLERDEDNYGNDSCKYCRKEKFTDDQILKYALKKLKTTKAKIVKEM